MLSTASQGKQTGSSIAARGTIQLLVARGCFMVSGYLISVILARGLGPVDYGTYGVIMSVLLWIEMLSSAGIPGAIAKFIPQYTQQTIVVETTARTLLLLVSLCLFVLGWALTPVLAQLFGLPTSTMLFRLAILDLPFNGLYLAYQGILNGHRRFGILSVGYIAYSLTKLAGTLVLLTLGLSVAGALIVNVLATIGALVYLVIKIPPKGWVPALSFLRVMLPVSLIMGLYLAALQVVLSLDLWLLKSMWSGSGEVIGFYVAALNVAKLPVIVPSVLSPLLFASLSWALANSDVALAQRYLRAASRFVLVVLFPCCALVLVYAEPIMILLYSEVYEAGGIYLGLQIIAFGLMALLDAFFHALMAVEKHSQATKSLLTLIPLALLLNFLLIPTYGALGAAIALVLTILGGTLFAAFLTYRQFGTLISFITVVRVMIATTGMLLIGSQIPLTGLWILIKFFTLFGVYVGLLYLLRELSRQDFYPLTAWGRVSH
jgi:stage V sporulation protein B